MLSFSSPVRFCRPLAFLPLLLLSATAHAGAKYQITDDWGSGFNSQVTVTNDQDRPLKAWTFEFDFDRNISLAWDATLVSHVGNHYTFKSAGWNDSVPARGSISFGFGGSPGNVKNPPTNYSLKGTYIGNPPATPTPTPKPTATPQPTATPKPTATPIVTPRPTATPLPTTDAKITIAQNGAWNGGFGATLEVANTGSEIVNGWTLRFKFGPQIDSLWNGIMSKDGDYYVVKSESWNGTIAPGGKASLGLNATGELDVQSGGDATLNGAKASLEILPGSATGPGTPASNIVIAGADDKGTALQLTVGQGTTHFALSLGQGEAGNFTVACNNPSVVKAQIVAGKTLQLQSASAGRAGLRIQTGDAVRYVGVRVKNGDGSLPGLPTRLALGSVSEDTNDHLDFWHGFGTGETNRYVDARYIYLNGGPQYGWTTWTNTPGGRAISYIRESKKMGMTPIFVWYNIPDGGESYTTDLDHIQSTSYLQDYFKMLRILTDVMKTESPDDPVILILEPDFLGYMAQNANKPASQITAKTSAAYEGGYLKRGVDPNFPDTVAGLVQAINYVISRDAPQAQFGWQMNLWASPAGGWTTPISGQGLMHLTDNKGVAAGRPMIYNEAKAITKYYLDAGVTSYGAGFLSIDKYGLDATAAEASAASDPANSTWFWNADHWNNYLTFVKAMHDTSKLPIVLWQLPVGHINSSQSLNPYQPGKIFPDLKGQDRQGEDSAPSFFFGDTFITGGKRSAFFSQNGGKDSSISASGDALVWGEHLSAARDAGVTMALFGAGVGSSTTNVGSPPSDSYWWITKAQRYLQGQ